MKLTPTSTAALIATAALGLSVLTTPPAEAQDQNEACSFPNDTYEFNQDEIDRLYDCLKDNLAKGYGKAGHEIGANFRSWNLTQNGIGPAFAGHGDRFLLTYANDIAFNDYVKYRDEGGFSMPVGSVLAKESWKVNKEGKPQRGPLLIMTKLKAGEADEFGNWLYSGVSPGSGKEFKVSQKFCHDCHGVFEDQDALGYPAEDVRLKAE